MRSTFHLVLFLAALLAWERTAWSVPLNLTYSGRLTDSGNTPLSGAYNIRVTFWNGPCSDSPPAGFNTNIPAPGPACSNDHDAQGAAYSNASQLIAGHLTSGPSNVLAATDTFSVSLTGGVFSATLYLSAADFHTLFPDSATAPWIQVETVTVSGGNVTGVLQTFARQQFSATPYALKVPVDGSSLTYNSNGQLQAGAALATKTANYTLTSSDTTILADATSASFTLTLPTAVGATGHSYGIKKIDSSIVNAVTVTTSSSQTISGATNYYVHFPGDSVTVASDGANWQIMSYQKTPGQCAMASAGSTGNLGGWTAVGAACKAVSGCNASTAHMCSYFELARMAQIGFSFGTGAIGWVADTLWDAPNGAVDNCLGWTNGTTSHYGSVLFGVGSPSSSAYLSYENCTGNYSILCCD